LFFPIIIEQNLVYLQIILRKNSGNMNNSGQVASI